jgi:uncharacterized protein with NRDE domain
MCIVFFRFSFDPNEPFQLVLVSNRDEFYTRPTKPAHFWEHNNDILAGMDLKPGRAGGTWLGMTKTGRIAALTNYYRQERKSDFNVDVIPVKGRGLLVVDYLEGQTSPEEYLKALEEKKSQYIGFNIIALDLRSEILEHISFYT